MTLAKTCHASSMMQELVEATHAYCDHKSCLNRDVSIVPLLNWKKIESHFETWSSDAQRINLTFLAHSFVANFVRYISAKYYLNRFPFHSVIMKVLGVNFFLKHSVYCTLTCTNHRHLLLLSPKADSHFTVLHSIQDWVELPSLLYTEMVYMYTNGHPSGYYLGLP